MVPDAGPEARAKHVAGLAGEWERLLPGLRVHGEPALWVDGRGRILHAEPSAWHAGTLMQRVAPVDRARVWEALRRATADGTASCVPAAGRPERGRESAWLWEFLPMDGAALVLLRPAQGGDRASLQEEIALVRDSERMASMGSWTWDLREPHAHWSPGLYRIYGLDPATHVPTYEDYLTRVHPDDRPRVETATTAAIERLQAYSHDERIRRTDGSWRHLHTWARPVLGPDGELAGLQGVCWDVTERKQAEMEALRHELRLEAIFDASAVGFAVVSRDGTLRDTNPAFHALFGPAKAGEPIWRHLDPGHVQAVREQLQKVAGMVGRRQTIEVRVAGPEERWVRMRFNGILGGADGDVLTVVEDATPEMVAATRAQQIEDLRRQGEAQRLMLDVAAHELRNPLTPLLLRLHLLRNGHFGALNDVQADALDKVATQASRLEALVGDLLDVGRLGSGRLRVQLVPVDLGALVADVVQQVAPQAEKWGVRVEAQCAPGTCMADRGRMERVLWNLITNALKFSPRGGAVTVEVKRVGDAWEVAVSDQGPGIDAEVREQVFAPYWHGARPGPDRPESSGLGLYVAKAMVEAQGGAIGLDHTAAGGARFWVRLPAA